MPRPILSTGVPAVTVVPFPGVPRSITVVVVSACALLVDRPAATATASARCLNAPRMGVFVLNVLIWNVFWVWGSFNVGGVRGSVFGDGNADELRERGWWAGNEKVATPIYFDPTTPSRPRNGVK